MLLSSFVQRVVGALAPQNTVSIETVEKEKNIKAAYAGGYFSPFRQDLNLQNEDPLQPSYWDELKELVKGTSYSKLNVSRMDLLSLFSSLIRPHLDAFEKQAEIEKYLANLREEDKECFFDSLSKEMPSCMAIAILRYASLEVRREICRATLKNRLKRDCYKVPCHWMREVIENRGLYPSAGDFLDQLFYVYPLSEQKELVYYFFFHHEIREQADFLSVLNKPLRMQIDKFFEEVNEFLEKALDAPISEIIYIPFVENQRKYFLHLFFTHHLHSINSALIAVSFYEKDWHILQAYVKESGRATFLLSWVAQVVEILLKKEKQGQERNNQQTYNTRLFFSNVFKILPNQLTLEQSRQLQKIAEAISPSLLAEHYSALNQPLFFRLLSPQKIIDLLSYYVKAKKVSDYENTVEEVIRDIWNSLDILHGFSVAFEMCFNFENLPGFENILLDFDLEQLSVIELTMYTSLPRTDQLKILHALLKNREKGMRKLFDWCRYCLLEELEKNLLPGVRPSIFRELNGMLFEVDKTLPGALRKILKLLKTEEITLDLLFPPAPEVAEARQQKAFNQLKTFLLNTHIGHLELQGLISSLHGDLHANMERSLWIPRLFEQTPKQVWPLLFFYFENTLKQRIERLNFPDWLPDRQKWIELATNVLLEVPSSQLHTYPDNRVIHWGITNLNQLLFETRSVKQVIRRLCEKAPMEKWIPIFDTFRQSYHANRNEFYKLIARGIEESQTNKVKFIAERFLALDQAKKGGEFHGIIDLEDALFDKPFIQTYQEEIDLLNYLIKGLGIHILDCFLIHPRVASRMVKVLLLQPNQGKETLLTWLDVLIQAHYAYNIKICVLERIASGYPPAEFLAFFTQPEFQPFITNIRMWYRVDTEKLTTIIDPFSITSWSLLQYFHKEATYPTIFSKIHQLKKKDKWVHIFICLEQIGKTLNKQELMDKLLTEEELAPFRSAYKDLIRKKGLSIMLTGQVGEMEATLAVRITDDWATQLDAWALQTLKEEDENYFSSGGLEESSYSTIIDVYNGLDRAGVLASWQEKFKKTLPKEYQKDFFAADQAYQRKKQEHNLERKEQM